MIKIRFKNNIWTKPILISVIMLIIFITIGKYIHLSTKKYKTHIHNTTNNISNAALYVQKSKSRKTENIINSIKTTKSTNQEKDKINTNNWEKISITKGMTLISIFKQNNVNINNLYQILKDKKTNKILRNIKDGQELYIATDTKGELLKLHFAYKKTENLVITKKNNLYIPKFNKERITTAYKLKQIIIESNLISAGLKHNIDFNLLDQIVKIFENNINFNKDIRKGDILTFVYKEEKLQNENINSGNILSAQIINKNKKYCAFYYKDNKNIQGYYFNDKGESIAQCFLDAPLKYTRISSKFNAKRVHPVLHTIRAHKGVDFAAPTGTPVYSSADGKITFIGRRGGYGKTIVIQHGKRFSTLYAHLSRYALHIKNGSIVKQEQIIGYVGQTGLATGPHLHYEFRINNVHIDPERAKEFTVDDMPVSEIAKFNKKIEFFKNIMEQSKKNKENIDKYVKLE